MANLENSEIEERQIPKIFFFPILSGGEVLYQGFKGGISYGMWRDPQIRMPSWNKPAMTWTAQCRTEEERGILD